MKRKVLEMQNNFKSVRNIKSMVKNIYDSPFRRSSLKFSNSNSSDMHAFTVECGPLGTNAGFIENVKNNEAVLIDAPPEAFDIGKIFLSENTKVVAVLFTHGHWDHCGDGHIFRELGAKTYAHSLEKPMIEDANLTMELMKFCGVELARIGVELIPCKVDVEINGDCEININDWLDVSCRCVPGHSPGSLAFYFSKFECAFVGDTLFNCGIGRSDLPGGDAQLLNLSIEEKILSMPDETIIIPGHGPITKIIDEKAYRRHEKSRSEIEKK
jgi:glyoxylase-like metal-dependent hydrolase (beta-lactamase superfamily II)